MQITKSRFYLLFFILLVANFQMIATVQAASNTGSQAGISFTEKEAVGPDTGSEIKDNSKPTPQSQVASSNLLPQTGSSAGRTKIVSFLFIVAGALLYHQNVKQIKIKEGINFLRKLRN